MDYSRFKSKVLEIVQKHHVYKEEYLKKIQEELVDLEHKKDLFVDATFVQKTMPQQVFVEQARRIDKDIQHRKASLIKTGTEPPDIDNILDFSGNLYKRPRELWENASIRKKICLQKFYFPGGVICDGQITGTASSSALTFVHDVLEINLKNYSQMAHDTSPIWNQIFDWAIEMVRLQEAICTPDDELKKWRSKSHKTPS